MNGGTLTTAAGVIIPDEKITVNGGVINIADGGPVVLNAASFLGGTLTGPVSGSANFSANAPLLLSAINSFTGQFTVVSGGSVTVTSAMGLGSPTLGTTVKGGTLTIAAASTEPVSVSGGVFNASGGYLGAVTLTSGTVNLTGPANGSISAVGGTLNVNAVEVVPLTAIAPAIVNINAAGVATVAGQGNIVNVNGTGSSNVTMTGGTVNLAAFGSAAVSVTNGYLATIGGGGAHTGSISLNNATLFDYEAGTINIFGPLTVSGTNTIATSGQGYQTSDIAFGGLTGTGVLTLAVGSTLNASSITLSAPTVFNGTMAISGTVLFSDINESGTLNLINSANGNVFYTGNTLFSGVANIGNFNLTFSGPSAFFEGNFNATGGVTVNTNASFSHFTLNGGGISGAGIFSVTDGELTATTGTINFTGTFSGFDSIDKISTGQLFVQAYPAFPMVPIDVKQGSVIISPSLGTSTPTINIQSQIGAAVQFGPGTFYTPVNLNNSFDGIQISPDNQLQTVTDLEGPIDLGSVGSTFDMMGGAFYLLLGGPISGGGLTFIVNRAAVLPLTQAVIESKATYTGPTTIKNGALEVTGPCQLLDTSSLVLEERGNFYVIDGYQGIYVPDRVPANVPVFMNEGQLELTNFYLGGPGAAILNVGTLTAQGGNNTILVSQNSTAGDSTVTMTIASINRLPGAVINFGPSAIGTLGDGGPTDPTIYITGQSATNFMGGAYTDGDNFVRYAGNGPGGLGVEGSISYSTLVPASWAADTNEYLTIVAQTLSGSHAVNSLKMATDFDISGGTLNITSGGLILDGHTISGDVNSRLTAGGTASSAELFIYYGGVISSSVTDNPGPDGLYASVPGGPEDQDNGAVSLVLTNGSFQLTGKNTYSGGTYVNSANLSVNSSAAAATSPVFLNDSSYIVNGNFTASPGVITMQEGTLTGAGSVNAAGYVMDAGSYHLLTSGGRAYITYGGVVQVPLLGNGPIAVNGVGEIDYADGANLQGYSGNITVNPGGILYIAQAQNVLTTLGQGVATVEIGGELNLPGGTVTGNVVLNGGLLSLTTTFAGSLSVQHDSKIFGGTYILPISLTPGSALALSGNIRLVGGMTGGGSLQVGDMDAATFESDGPLGNAPVVVNGQLSMLNPVGLGPISGRWGI